MGGYYMHGKDFNSKKKLIDGAKALEVAGVFALVLECVDSKLSTEITDALSIPTIGIGSGKQTDGQVLVLNDLLGMSPDKTPGFVTPLANLFSLKKTLIDKYLYETQPKSKENLENNHVH